VKYDGIFVYEIVAQLRAVRGKPINASDLKLMTCRGEASVKKAAGGREEKICYPT
jgi:hypothetical protein